MASINFPLIPLIICLVQILNPFVVFGDDDVPWWDLRDCNVATIRDKFHRSCVTFKRSAKYVDAPHASNRYGSNLNAGQKFDEILEEYFGKAKPESVNPENIPQPQPRYYQPSESIPDQYATVPVFLNKPSKYYLNRYDNPENELGIPSAVAPTYSEDASSSSSSSDGNGNDNVGRGWRRQRRSVDTNSADFHEQLLQQMLRTLISNCCSPSGCDIRDFIRLDEIYRICDT